MNSAQPADRTPDDQPPAQPGTLPAEPAALPAEPGIAAAPLPAQPATAVAAPPEGAGAGDEQVVPAAMRSQRSTKDIVISLLVLLVPIALVIGFARVFLGADQPVVIDPAPVLQEARAANAFPVSEPTGLGDGWRTVLAEFRREAGGATLRIGYIAPDGGGVQMVQSSLPADGLLRSELTRDGRPLGGTVEVGGRSWQRYTARPDESALVLVEPGRTVLVVGQAPESELQQMVASLR
ncbi:DUF4245 domain-containing protein [Plantactinospora endophytica]|uniref:DUF4245 domain-containing protein n=1 Tax=Plantactinospora endophytica TaxID=673535 RepID=A0ABQ4DTH7_9ACTN|nr:DUF4245 domain-containing protein [Plantactinospora endophytica]GIG85761.1 hypothetical protein Pen02_06970 [Plantactinospora endophytica]